MIRKTLVTLALTAGMVGGTAGIASAHECYVANRSEKGNVAATHSGAWATLELRHLFEAAHNFLNGPELTEDQVDEALQLAEAAGVPLSVAVFESTTIPRGGKDPAKSGDGKGIDHYFAAHIETVAGIYFDVAYGGV